MSVCSYHLFNKLGLCTNEGHWKFRRHLHVVCSFNCSYKFGVGKDIIWTDRKADYIRDDNYVDGNLLLAISHKVMTYSSDGGFELIAGGNSGARYKEGVRDKAGFGWVTSLRQINSTALVVVDKSSHCIRLIDRETNGTSQFAGNCTVSGGASAMCSSQQCTFDHPYDIQLNDFEEDFLYITDASNHAIRRMDLVNNSVSIFIADVKGPRYIEFDNKNQVMYVTIETGLLRVPVIDVELRSLVLATAVSNDFFGLALLDSNTVVVAALKSNSVQVALLEGSNSSASNICVKPKKMKVEARKKHKMETPFRCEVYVPYSVAVVHGALLIGQVNFVKRIAFSSELHSSLPHIRKLYAY